jgi:hypothetical protein
VSLRPDRNAGALDIALRMSRAEQLNSEDHQMFIAMNRFRVAKGCEASFEQVWLSRDSHLDKVPAL